MTLTNADEEFRKALASAKEMEFVYRTEGGTDYVTILPRREPGANPFVPVGGPTPISVGVSSDYADAVIESYGSAPHPGVVEILPPSQMNVVHEDRVVVSKYATPGPSCGSGTLAALQWAFTQHWTREDFFPDTPYRKERRRLRRAAIREGRFHPGQRNYGK